VLFYVVLVLSGSVETRVSSVTYLTPQQMSRISIHMNIPTNE